MHKANIKYNELVNQLDIEFQKYGKSNPDNSSYPWLPIEINKGLKSFIGRLKYHKWLDEFGEKYYQGDTFLHFSPLVHSFRKTIRFSHQMKMSEIILFNASIIPDFWKKFWYLDLSKELDVVFTDIFISTKNINQAIGLVLENAMEYGNGVGGLKVTAEKWNNKVVLRIIDLKSTSKKNVQDLEAIMNKGNLGQIRALLFGYCNFNIRAIFPRGQFKVSSLPYISSSPSENYEPKGFTYEFIFYRPIKLILVDNNNVRREIAKNNLDSKFIRDSFFTFKETIDTNDLDFCNAVFIHKSNPEYKEVYEVAKLRKLPILSFSGDETTLSTQENTNDIFMSDEDFYNSLNDAIRLIQLSSIVSLEPFLSKDVIPNLKIENDSIYKINNDIRANSIDLKKLPTEYVHRIRQFVGDIDLPEFNRPKQLRKFILRNIIE